MTTNTQQQRRQQLRGRQARRDAAVQERITQQRIAQLLAQDTNPEAVTPETVRLRALVDGCYLSLIRNSPKGYIEAADMDPRALQRLIDAHTVTAYRGRVSVRGS